MDLTGTGIGHWDSATGKPLRYAYGAESPSGRASDEARRDFGLKWRPSIHMPREACRLALEITGVRIERLHAGDGDVPYESRYLAEGINRIHHGDGDFYYSAFRDEPAPNNWTDPFDAWRELWKSTGADWDSNPWVWVIEFKVADRPQEMRHG
ncbi:hypothetical protein [Pseudomonas sp.]|uniref:hypothetical protein n=1 Tax=Pseudomonas sp. TaxID=306 RepID=UPI003D0CAA25